jgi:hypothetical protein
MTTLLGAPSRRHPAQMIQLYPDDPYPVSQTSLLAFTDNAVIVPVGQWSAIRIYLHPQYPVVLYAAFCDQNGLERAAGTRAVATFTRSGLLFDGITYTIGSKVYTFKNSLGGCAANAFTYAPGTVWAPGLVQAINKEDPADVGYTAYCSSTLRNGQVSAEVLTGDSLKITALAPGTWANSITLADSDGFGAWDGATMHGGTGGADRLSIDGTTVPGALTPTTAPVTVLDIPADEHYGEEFLKLRLMLQSSAKRAIWYSRIMGTPR